MNKLQMLKEILIGIVKAILEFLKKIWYMIISNPEAILTLILAGIGLTYLIGEITIKMKCPDWMEQSMMAPAISGLTMMGIVALMQRRAKCQIG